MLLSDFRDPIMRLFIIGTTVLCLLAPADGGANYEAGTRVTALTGVAKQVAVLEDLDPLGGDFGDLGATPS